MASRCGNELGKEKQKPCIVIRTDNECSTDEQVIHCCSIKGIKELLPALNRNNNNNNTNKKYCENILKSKEHLDNYMQIYHCKTKQNLINKKDLIKQDERMYDLAHLLFKISDLSLKVTEYEKIYCVKESDLHKMLNIVKVEIMKSFLKGKTRYETMNKIILRLMYLDEIIQEMYDSKVGCNNTKIINQNTIKTNIDKKQCTQINKKQTIKNNEMKRIKTINRKETINTDNNSIDEITIAPTSSNLTAPYNRMVVPQNTLRENKNYSLSGKKENYSLKNVHESVISNKNLKLSQRSAKSSKSCYMTHNKSDYDKQTENNKIINKSIIKSRKQCLKLIDESVQTELDKLSTIERYSAATSYEDIYVNPNRSMPNISANQLWKQRHIPKLNPKDWVEIDGHMEMVEIPVDKLNKQISAQKLKKIDEMNENVENNAQTDDMLLTENGDYQIVSMTILYSKTHARYIVPNWKPVDYNIDESPKVLSKQDLDDGMALTSYKADQDGTIHFTLTFANNELSNLANNGDVATKKLVKQLKEIRGLWAESARILYNTLVKEYDEQNIKVEFTNYDTKSTGNKNDEAEENPNVESSFVSSNPYSNY